MPRVTLRLDEEEWQALRRLAESECRSMNAEVRKLILEKAAARGVYSPRPRLVKTGT